MSNWIHDWVTKRTTQRTSTYFIETFDKMMRLQELQEIARNDKLKELFKKPFHNMVAYNLQRNELYNWKSDPKHPPRKLRELDQMTNPLTEIDTFLLADKTLAVIEYVFAEHHARALSEHLAAWSTDNRIYGNESTVLVFTSDANLFSETLRRLSYTISIEPSTAEERRTVITSTVNPIAEAFEVKYGRPLGLEVTEDIVQSGRGLTLYSVQSATLESIHKYKKLEVSAYTDYKVNILETYGLSYVEPNINFGLVGGAELLKEYMRNRVIIPLRNPEKAKYYGVGLPRGILLNGLPGTGKSYFAEAIAGELKLPMVKLGPSDLLRGIVGASEARTRQILMLIEALAPCVVNFEELDAIAPSRNKMMMTDSGVTRRITNKLLEWSGSRQRKAFLIGSTNYLVDVDFAFKRPGRFDEIVLVLPPDASARLQILKLHSNVIRKLPLEPDIDFGEIIQKTLWWTPAELEKLCLDAGRTAMDNDAKHVTIDHFHEALGCLEINVKERETKVQADVANMRKLDIVNKGFLNLELKQFEAHEPKDRIKSFIQTL